MNQLVAQTQNHHQMKIKMVKKFKISSAGIDWSNKNQKPLDESKLKESQELITTEIKIKDWKYEKEIRRYNKNKICISFLRMRRF